MGEENIHLVSLSKAEFSYGVIFGYYQGDNKEKQIHYTVDIAFVPQGSHYLLTLSKDKVYYNNEGADLISEQFSEAVGKSLFPLELEVSRQMELISLLNTYKIEERWKQQRAFLQNYYIGKTAEKVFSLMDEAYSHSAHIRQIIKKNLFFDLYFFPAIYREVKEEVRFNIYPFIPPITYTLNERKTDKSRSGKIRVSLKGNCTDTRSWASIENKDRIFIPARQQELIGILDLQYKLDESSGLLYSLIGSLSVGISKKEKRKIEVEIYKLNRQVTKMETITSRFADT